MKCSEFSKFIDDAQKICGVPASSNALDELVVIRQILALTPSKTVLLAAKQLVVHRDGLAQRGGSGQLSVLAGFLQSYGKPAVAKDALAIADLLGDLDGNGLRVLAERAAATHTMTKSPNGKGKDAPVRQELVARYNRRLEETLGDDPGFNAVVAQLESDASITGSEYAALTKSFCLKTSKTKVAALKNIRARHQNLMTSRAKSAATAGRIAG